MIRSWTRSSWTARRWLAIGFTLVVLGAALTLASLKASPEVPMAHARFIPHAIVHLSHGSDAVEPSMSKQVETSTKEIARQLSTTQLMPATRGSFMAVWQIVGAASGYRLDVATDSAFAHYVPNYRDLDVGNVNTQIVAGLQPAKRYYYRVRAYDSAGSATSGNSEVATAQTTSINAGLVISPTFDTSISQNAKAAQIEAEINQAIALFQSLFSDPINVSILFRYANTSPTGQKLNGAIAQSFFVAYQVPWDDFVSALRADAKTPNDASANASLPPFALTPNIHPSSAGGRAVGLNTPGVMSANGAVGQGGTFDGIVTLNSGVSIQFTRPPGSTSFDGLTAIEHEMDEVLGLGSHLDPNVTDLRPQDLFSFSGFATRNTTRSGARYFSIDNGQTDIVNFNQMVGGDAGDWLSQTCPQTTPYVQNAFGCPGQFDDVSATSPEGINLDVVGYDLATVPAPPTANPATNVTTSSFVANWNAEGAVNGYRLDVSDDPAFGSFVAGFNNLDVGNVTSRLVTGLTDHTTYYYRLRAYNNFGTSGNSNIVSVFTVVPTPTPIPSPTPTPITSPGPTATPYPTVTPAMDDWSAYQHDPARTGRTSATIDPAALSLVWSTPQFYSTPLVAGNAVYATLSGGGGSTTVTSFNLATGAINWTYSNSFAFHSDAAVAGQIVVFEAQDVVHNISSLYVLDAATGHLRYTVAIPEVAPDLLPTLARDPNTGAVTAYIADAFSVSAVALGPTSGAVLWTQSGNNFGGALLPTVVSNSIILTGADQYYAFDRATGAMNHFHVGTSANLPNGGSVASFDAVRSQFYIFQSYGGQQTPTLSAYHYTDNDHITLLWQRAAQAGNSVAIGSNGYVYFADPTARFVYELDPDTGAMLRSISGYVQLGATPAVSNGVLWTESVQITAYDLNTFQPLAGFNASNAFKIAALTNGYLLFDDNGVIRVYSNSPAVTPTPTPSATPTPTTSPTPTLTPTPSPTPTGSPTPTATATPTPTSSPTPTPTPSPTLTPTPTATPIPPTVSLSAFPPSVGKGGTATFTVSATSTALQPIAVDFFMSGNAIEGFDYTLTPNQLVIPPGQSSSSIILTVITTKTRGREKATMTLSQGPGYNLPASSGRRRTRSRAPQASVTIQNR